MTRVGILGANGYAGREVVRLLAAHPAVEIAFATSESGAGQTLDRLVRGAPALALVPLAEAPLGQGEVVVSCLPHGESALWVRRARDAGARVIDLSSDLRVRAQHEGWPAEPVYGLSELHRERVRGADVVANPGCYPTATLLALAPLLRLGLVDGPVVVHAASGVTGAGRAPRAELLFGEVAEDFRAYGLGNTHRHLAEMREQAEWLAGSPRELVFVPHLLPVRRGILCTLQVPLSEPLAQPREVFRSAYEAEPFVEVLETAPSLRDVVGSNRVAISAFAVEGVSRPMLTVVSAVDNLIKGAAGQAVQNLNLMLALPEALGLA